MKSGASSVETIVYVIFKVLVDGKYDRTVLKEASQLLNCQRTLDIDAPGVAGYCRFTLLHLLLSIKLVFFVHLYGMNQVQPVDPDGQLDSIAQHFQLAVGRSKLKFIFKYSMLTVM